MTEKKRIAIDMDEVIADTMAQYIALYKQRQGFELTPRLLAGKEVRDALPEELKDTLKPYLNEPGFFRHIPVMADSQEVLAELHQQYEVFIVSAAMEFKNSLIDKYEWLGEHFPFIPWSNIIFCGRKIVNVDIFIDDRSRNFKDFDGRKLLFTAHHNINEIVDYERVNNWKEVGEKLL